jgi:membrane-associated phospholipid phosphatase
VTVRRLLVVAAAAALVVAAGILALDAAAARAIGPDAGKTQLAATLAELLRVLDQITLMTWPKKEPLAIGLVAIGAGWWWWRPRARAGHALVLIGLTHAISRTLGGHLKPLLGRLRPGEALARGHVDDSFWWRDGLAFPSGHVAHYAALAFAIALVWPRATWPAVAVLALVCAARIAVNAHWLSDVAGSIAIAALAAAGWSVALDRLRARAVA